MAAVPSAMPILIQCSARLWLRAHRFRAQISGRYRHDVPHACARASGRQRQRGRIRAAWRASWRSGSQCAVPPGDALDPLGRDGAECSGVGRSGLRRTVLRDDRAVVAELEVRPLGRAAARLVEEPDRSVRTQCAAAAPTVGNAAQITVGSRFGVSTSRYMQARAHECPGALRAHTHTCALHERKPKAVAH